MPAAAAERMVHVNGVELCVQEFGDDGDPLVLLIMGTGASMLHFPEPFCDLIAAGGLRVVRYDHRDTGRSSCFPVGAGAYSGEDLTDDAIGLLDALGSKPAHLVGFSAGGGIAQDIAIGYPDRIESLTLIATSPATPGERELPGISDAVAPEFAALRPPADWADRSAVIDYLIAWEHVCASPTRPPDDAYLRDLVERTVDRARSIESIVNHDLLESEESLPPDGLERITAPTLVIHGTDDPLFPLPHGEALAAEIPGARLIELPGNGHELPPTTWEPVAAAIVAHAGGSA